MHYAITIGLLAVGLLAVIKGGDWFVDAASWIAKACGIPSFIIGATIVSVATTLPEIIVSSTAAVAGSNDMAIGNAVGSVTVNTGLIMSLAFIFLSVTVVRREYLVQCLLLIAAGTVLIVGSLGGALSIVASCILLAVFLAFMTYNVVTAKRHDLPTAKAEAPEETIKATGKDWALRIGLFVLGAAAIVVGSDLLVDNGIELARLFGISERLIAVTLVALGTSLPELVTTLTAIRKKEASLSVGNIIGANIIDLSLILPLCSVLSGKPIPISAANLALDLPACLIVIIVALVPMLIREKAGKVQGAGTLAAYTAYIILSL